MTEAQLLAALKKWRLALAEDDKRLGHLHYKESLAAAAKQRALKQIAQLNAELRQPAPRTQAVHHALDFVGVKENPPNSNTGPHINTWESEFGIHAQPWCGAFVGAMIELTGHKVDRGIVYTPNIKTFAQRKAGGFHLWITKHEDARAGDLALFDFPDATHGIQHVGMVRRRQKVSGLIDTVEGNTSFSNGSQDNGGCVAVKTRPTAYVVGYARWW